MDGFARVEQRTATLNVQRAQDALLAEIESLDLKLTDWAAWDDAYRYVIDHNAEFEKANLTHRPIQSLGLAAIIILDNAGRMVFSAGVDPDGRRLAPLPTGLARMVTERDPFL